MLAPGRRGSAGPVGHGDPASRTAGTAAGPGCPDAAGEAPCPGAPPPGTACPPARRPAAAAHPEVTCPAPPARQRAAGVTAGADAAPGAAGGVPRSAGWSAGLRRAGRSWTISAGQADQPDQGLERPRRTRWARAPQARRLRTAGFPCRARRSWPPTGKPRSAWPRAGRSRGRRPRFAKRAQARRRRDQPGLTCQSARVSRRRTIRTRACWTWGAPGQNRLGCGSHHGG